MTAKLRLGRLPNAQQVRLTIVLSSELKANLDRYAEVHSQATGQRNDVERLIPYILESFIARDRGFRAASRQPSPTPEKAS